jgi:hypothetical protein
VLDQPAQQPIIGSQENICSAALSAGHMQRIKCRNAPLFELPGPLNLCLTHVDELVGT